MMGDCLQAESRGQRMREVEPAHVIALSYVISNDGASDSCARLTLRLSDPESPLQGRTFDVELPPATNGHAEFVIPRHRFLASVNRMWKRGDCCQVPFLLPLSLPPLLAVRMGVDCSSAQHSVSTFMCSCLHASLQPCSYASIGACIIFVCLSTQ